MTRKATGLSTAFIVLTFAANAAYAVHAVGKASAGQQKAAQCIACHMVDGNSVNPEWPKLAGQIPTYLFKQLQTFKDGTRVDETMSPMVKALSEEDMKDIATYYASQTRSPGVGKPELLAEGEKLYKKGVFYTSVTACVGCHGLKGEGNEAWHELLAAPPSTLAPAVGGQHATYLVNQLKAFRSGERANDVGG